MGGGRGERGRDACYKNTLLFKWWADYKNTGSYRRRSLPFPLVRAFLPPPLPPLFALATQATCQRSIVPSPVISA